MTWSSSKQPKAGKRPRAYVLRHPGLLQQVRKGADSFDKAADIIKVLAMRACKGLEFPVVALVGAGRMPAEGEDEREEARLFYVEATRATQRLVIGARGDRGFASRFYIAERPGLCSSSSDISDADLVC